MNNQHTFTIFYNRARKFFFFLLLFFTCTNSLSAQLIINEVSQGSGGTKEYVELLVTGTPNCVSVPTVDLRGWYIDDNNGNHATGTGTGIASGCMRFTTNALWASVPIGTIILIYNDADIEPGIPAADLSLSDGNCRLVIPASNCTLLEKNSAQPSTATSVYPSAGFTACGNWTTVGMSNSDDSFQTLDPAATMIHSVSWGNNSISPVIYFAGASGGMVIFMNNATNNNPSLQTNWVRTPVSGNETPGAPNNAANASWINSMNNNCGAITPLVVSATGNSTCSCTGTATATASGSTGPYAYSWAPSGGNNATATGLCPGSYTVTATSLSGCTETATVTILASTPMTLSSTNSPVSCHGGSNGSATVNVSGGSGNYTYSWAPYGGTSSNATGLNEGTYTVTVVDNGGCTDNITVTITEPPAFSISTSQTNVSCNGGNTGSATVNVSGGTGPYSYAWGPSGGSNATAVNLTADSYTVSIGDANGCSTIQFLIISEPPPLVVSVGAGGNVCANDSISLSGSASGNYTSILWQGGTGTFFPQGSLSTNYIPGSGDNGIVILTLQISDSCGNSVDTQLTVNVLPLPDAQINATGPVTFCSGGSVTLNGSGGNSYLWSTSATSASITVNASGTYTLTSTNTCGSDTATVTINVLPLPNAQITANGPTTLCPGDSVSLTASGGTTYLWNTSETTSSITAQTAGTFSVVVSNSCGSDSAFVNISVMPSPNAQITASGPLAFCTGDSITLTATGGNTYLWSTNATSSSIVVSNAGVYSVIATVSCGTDTAYQTVTTIPAPVAVIASSGPTTFCAGDSVTLTASGGTSYLWSTGATSASITVLAAGNYYVIATVPCGSDTAFQPIVINPLPNAIVTASGPATFCAGNNVALTASGGITYLWSTGATTASIIVNTSGTYTVTSSNACGSVTAQRTITVLPLPSAAIVASGPLSFCQGDSVTLTASGGTSYAWSTGDTIASITVNTAGNYTVTTTNSCGTATAQQTVTVLALPAASITASGPTTFCAGNNVTLTASGGTSYLWSNGNSSSSITVNSGATYSVVVTNACGSASAFQVTNILPLPVAQVSGNISICPGEQTTLTATGGTNYLWNTTATTSSITTGTPGTYSVIVSNACGSDTAQVTVTSSTVLASFTATPDSGAVPLFVSFNDNSVNAFSWSWDFGDGNNSSSADPSNVFQLPGTYPVILTVTNSDGCTDTAIVFIIVSDVAAVIEIPNVFTPNGDGTNDLFMIRAEGLADFHLEIYDRWGVLLSTIDTAGMGWDGKTTSGSSAVDGTYYYIFHAKGYNGKEYSTKGFFTLLQ